MAYISPPSVNNGQTTKTSWANTVKNDLDDLNSRITSNDGDIASLDSRVDTLESAPSQVLTKDYPHMSIRNDINQRLDCIGWTVQDLYVNIPFAYESHWNSAVNTSESNELMSVTSGSIWGNGKFTETADQTIPKFLIGVKTSSVMINIAINNVALRYRSGNWYGFFLGHFALTCPLTSGYQCYLTNYNGSWINYILPGYSPSSSVNGYGLCFSSGPTERETFGCNHPGAPSAGSYAKGWSRIYVSGNVIYLGLHFQLVPYGIAYLYTSTQVVCRTYTTYDNGVW